MPENIELEIITSTEKPFRTEIKDLYIPAYLGKVGILKNHLPYLSLLNYGEVSYKDIKDISHYLFIQDGIVEVKENKIVIITDSIERGEEFDQSEIEAKLNEINSRIESSKKGEITPEELEEALIEQLKLKIKFNITQKITKK